MGIMCKKGFILIGLVCSLTFRLFAQDKSPDSSSNRLSAYPVLYYTPETRLAFGAGGAYVLNRDTLEGHIRIGNIQFIASYTLEDQILIQAPFELWPDSARYFVKGDVGFFRFPYRFHGVGNSVEPGEYEGFSATFSRLVGSGYRRLTSDLYAGPRVFYEEYIEVDFEDEGKLETSGVPGISGGSVTGLGAGLRYDSRNDVFFPQSGWLATIDVVDFGKWIVSDYDFTRTELDVRRYWSVGKKSVIAGQFLTMHSWGEVPFQLLPMLGGQRFLRGYYQGAYRDKHQYSMQAAWRHFILPRWGFSVFAGVGTVHGYRDFWPLLPAGGGGIRFLINREQNINLRVDYAVGVESTGIYVNVTEAF